MLNITNAATFDLLTDSNSSVTTTNITRDLLANATVCLRIDYGLEKMVDMRESARRELNDSTSVIAPVFILVLSLVVLLFGARLFRLASALSAGAFAFWAVYSFIRTSSDQVSCEASIIIASFMALIAAISAGCILKAGLFFVGAAGAAGLVHLIFTAFPGLHDMGDQPTLLDKSFAYWGLILLSAIAGGLVLRWNSKPILEVATSFVGGTGLAYALHSINDTAGGSADNWVFMLSGLVAAIVGILVQRNMRLRGCKRRQSNSEVAMHI